MEAGTCSPLLMKTRGTGLLCYPTASKEPVPSMLPTHRRCSLVTQDQS